MPRIFIMYDVKGIKQGYEISLFLIASHLKKVNHE